MRVHPRRTLLKAAAGLVTAGALTGCGVVEDVTGTVEPIVDQVTETVEPIVDEVAESVGPIVDEVVETVDDVT